MTLVSLFRFSWIGIAAGLAAIAGLAQGAEKKTPVPDDAAQGVAMKLVKEVYGQDFANAKRTDQKVELAKKLLEKAETSPDDRTIKFVLLKSSKNVALQALNVEATFEAIDKIDRSFEVDALAMKVDALGDIERKIHLPSEQSFLARNALGLTDRAVAEERFDIAGQLGDLALEDARKAHIPQLLRQAQKRVSEVHQEAAMFAETKAARDVLTATPRDPAANLTVGKYDCFIQGDWEKGIPMLALGSDEDLKSLALAELKGASSSGDRTKLGDAAWDLAEKQKEGLAKNQLRKRAAVWYRQASPSLAGLVKDKVEKRLTEIDESEDAVAMSPSTKASPIAKGKWVLIFRSSDPAVWNTDSPDKDRFAIPLANAPENIRFLKMQMNPKEFVVIPLTKPRLTAIFVQGKLGWRGDNHLVSGGHELGIFERSTPHDRNDDVCISFKNDVGGLSGWGFGYKRSGDDQGWAWDAKPIGRTVFEIDVTSENLTALETSHLLK